MLHPTLTVRVYADGHEELMRNAVVSGISATTFRSIVAASNSQTMYTLPTSFRAMMANSLAMLASGTIGGEGAETSIAIPSLLFANASVARPTSDQPRLPLVKPPGAP